MDNLYPYGQAQTNIPSYQSRYQQPQPQTYYPQQATGSLMTVYVNGEVLQDTIAVATPAAVGDYWHVSGFAYIDVPRGCCFEVSVENASPQSSPTTPAPSIDIRNLNVAVNRVA